MQQPKINSCIQEWLDANGVGLESVQIEDCGMLPFAEFAVWHPIDGSPAEAPLLRFKKPPRLQAFWIGQRLMCYFLESEDTDEDFTELDDVGTDTDRFFLVHPSQFESAHAWFWDNPDFEALGGKELVEVVEGGEQVRMVVITSHDGNARIHAACLSDGTMSAALIET